MTLAIATQRLRVDRGGAPVIRELAISITAGAWFGVIGANGSGKTTLLRALAGRLPIAAGHCTIDGVALASDRAGRAARIGFAPPIERMPASLRIGQLLALAGDDCAAQQRRNPRLWAALGLPALLDRKVGTCSSGMRQRAAVALAFARATPIVILDEPFNWLDPVAAFDTRAALADIVRSGTTLVTALHELTTVCGYCDEAIVLRGGEIGLKLSNAALREGQGDIRGFEERLIAALRE